MPGMRVLADLVGESPGIRAVRETVARLLARQQDGRRLPSILIQGETGTGKGLLARMIHREGPRPDGPFVDVNCAAIPDTLLEAEMFGFERGAFTDARRSKPGLFQAAHRGTIFLDEVGLLPEGLQAKLLKVLEERSVRRLGATRDEHVDVWVITATNEDLKAAIGTRRFREDLYHRLAVITVALPPLRERGADVLTLAEHFLARLCDEYGVPGKTLAVPAKAALRGHRWPGNVRELSNVIERAVLMSSSSEITADALVLGDAPGPAAATLAPAAESPVSLEDAMRGHLVEVLTRTSWNISRTATLLGISRNTLRARMDRYGLRERGSEPKPQPVRVPASRAVSPVVSSVASPLPSPAPASSARRWERRRVALLRVALVPATGPQAPLATSRVLEDLVDKASTFGGSLDGLGPIGLIAVFGLGAGDAADRAAHAAMAMLKAVERARRDERADIAARIGLHVSTALVGISASGVELDMDERHGMWPLLDELVERASLDTIVVSESATLFLRRRFELAPGPGTVSSGAATQILVGRERTGLGLGGRLAEFVGRQYELEVLRTRLESIRRGQGQVITIMGEAGIGKSRLAHEFRRLAAVAGVKCLDAHCFPYGSAVPYLPVLDIVRAICGIGDIDTPEVVAERVHRALVDHGLDAGQLSPYVLHLLGIKEDSVARALDLEPEAAIRTRIFDVVRQLLRRQSQRVPLALIVDDVHWIDRTSEECLASIVDSLPGSAILLVVTSRPGYRAPWHDKSYATHVALQPLGPTEARQVVHSVLGNGPLPPALVQTILDRAEGNAFFLEELARAVREHPGPATAVVVPDTVQDVLQARIDRLGVEDRRLLAAAAVIGKDFTRSLLEAALEGPAEGLDEGLARLQAGEFVYETSGGPDPQFSFRHALTHEVAYGGLPAADRRALHGLIADALDAGPRGRSSEDLARLAHHALGAERWALGLTTLRAAGARAVGAGAHQEAVACYAQALDTLDHLPTTDERRRDGIDLRIELRTALLPLGEHERIIHHLREAEETATALDDRSRLGRVCTYLTNYYFITGDQTRALEHGRRALAIAETVGDIPLLAEANLRLGQVYYALAEYRRAVGSLTPPLASLTGESAFERFGLPLIFAVGCRNWLIRALAELGEFEEGARHSEEAIRIADAAGHPFSRAVAYLSMGYLFLRKGEVQRAFDVLAPGLDLARTWSIRAWVPRLATALGSALAFVGRSKEALPLLEQAVADSAAMNAIRDDTWATVALGEALLLAGQRPAAARAATRAFEQARGLDDRGIEAWAQRLHGETALPDRAADAAAAFRASLAQAEHLEMRPLAAHCRFGLGRTAVASGATADGIRQIEDARADYARLGMRLWMARADAELARLG
jgi:transcriptional regulator with AAA-type ATPase domain/tetratricopeptide (TPR) repeat protein